MKINHPEYQLSPSGFPGADGDRLWYVRHQEAPTGCTLGYDRKYFVRADGSWKSWSDGVWTAAEKAPWAQPVQRPAIAPETPMSMEGKPLLFVGRCLAAGMTWSNENESHTPCVNGRDLCYRVLYWQGRRYLAFEWTGHLWDDRTNRLTLEQVISGEITGGVNAESAEVAEEECPFDAQPKSLVNRTRGLSATPAPSVVREFVSMKEKPVTPRGATKQKGLF